MKINFAIKNNNIFPVLEHKVNLLFPLSEYILGNKNEKLIKSDKKKQSKN
jgi:hypothetical protein